MNEIVYQYNLQGYYIGETIAYNNLLPVNTTEKAPTLQDGYIPKWNGIAWEQVENHVGKEGYVNGEEFTVTQYGALPEGFSDTAPEPTLEEAKTSKLAEIKQAFETVSASGYTVSSLGYRVDATTTSLTDVQGLMRLVNGGLVEVPVLFRDYDNAFHETSLEDFQTLETEITVHGVTVYAEKWALEAQVESAETVEAVQAVDTTTMSGYDWE